MSANAISTIITGSIIKPNVLAHPTRSARRGAASVASSAPELPAPAIPIANP